MKTEAEFPNGRCCVFQPFDKGDFDKRFDDILVPAITNAGMEPYRVDRDLGATIPVDTLHQEIRSAVICLADITNRNPNVMYELGFAIAAGKDVVIICGPSVERFPFDIQHRGILSYAIGAPSDFRALERDVTEKLKAILSRQEKTTSVVDASPIKASHGLQAHELTALALLLASSDSVSDSISANFLKQEMKKAGYNDAGCRIALAQLERLGYVTAGRENNGEESWVVYRLTKQGEDWLLANQSVLQISNAKGGSASKYADMGITDEDIPF